MKYSLTKVILQCVIVCSKKLTRILHFMKTPNKLSFNSFPALRTLYDITGKVFSRLIICRHTAQFTIFVFVALTHRHA